MNGNEKQKSNKGLIILIVILLIAVVALSGYIVYDKIIDKDSNSDVTEIDVKKENEEELEEDKIIEIFNQKKVSYKLQDGSEIIYTQSISSDMNSGIEVNYKGIGNMLDVEGYYNLESVGIVENTDNIIVVALMGDNNGNKNVFYEKLLKSKLNDTSITDDAKEEYFISSNTKLNTDYVVDQIGKVEIDNINYPVIVSNNSNYIINEDGSLSNID